MEAIDKDLLDVLNSEFVAATCGMANRPHIEVSRKNAVCVEGEAPIGYHLILGVRDVADRTLSWSEVDEGYQDHLLTKARCAGRTLRKKAGLDDWGLIIECADKNSATGDNYHCHIILYPPNAKIAELGLERIRAVDPHLRPMRPRKRPPTS